MNVTPFDVFAAVAVSGTTVYRSLKTSVKLVKDSSYTLEWTGTPAGTFVVQVSNRPSTGLSDSTDTGWVTLTLDRAITQPAGAASGDAVDLAGLPYAWVRLKYTNASGSGNITAYVTAKGG